MTSYLVIPSIRLLYSLIGEFQFQSIFLLYLGPETIMPLATILATIIGFFLIFWRFIVKTAKRIVAYSRSMLSGTRQPHSPEAERREEEKMDENFPNG